MSIGISWHACRQNVLVAIYRKRAGIVSALFDGDLNVGVGDADACVAVVLPKYAQSSKMSCRGSTRAEKAIWNRTPRQQKKESYGSSIPSSTIARKGDKGTLP